MLNGIASPTWLRAATNRAASAGASSGTAQVSISSRQMTALLPSDLSPVEAAPVEQEVPDSVQEAPAPAEALRRTAERVNEYLVKAGTHLKFVIGEQTGRVVIQVINSETEEVVRAIPPESLDRFANRTTQLQGLLFETTG